MESDQRARARARAAFEDLVAGTQGTALVESHGYFIRTLLAACVLGLGPEGVRTLRVRNCRPAVVELTRPPLLLGLNLDGPEALDAD